MPRTPNRLVVSNILDAAALELSNHGPEALTSTNVATAANVSVQTIYNRFGSIDGLLDDLTNRSFRRLTAELVADAQARQERGQVDQVAVLVGILRQYRRFARADPERHRFLFNHPARDRSWSSRTRAAAAEPLSVVAAATGQAIAAGQLLPIDRGEAASCLWVTARGAVDHDLALWPDGGRPVFDRAIATIIRGLRPRAQLR